jgi:hypothetical protein
VTNAVADGDVVPMLSLRGLAESGLIQEAINAHGVLASYLPTARLAVDKYAADARTGLLTAAASVAMSAVNAALGSSATAAAAVGGAAAAAAAPPIATLVGSAAVYTAVQYMLASAEDRFVTQPAAFLARALASSPQFIAGRTWVFLEGDPRPRELVADAAPPTRLDMQNALVGTGFYSRHASSHYRLLLRRAFEFGAPLRQWAPHERALFDAITRETIRVRLVVFSAVDAGGSQLANVWTGGAFSERRVRGNTPTFVGPWRDVAKTAATLPEGVRKSFLRSGGGVLGGASAAFAATGSALMVTLKAAVIPLATLDSIRVGVSGALFKQDKYLPLGDMGERRSHDPHDGKIRAIDIDGACLHVTDYDTPLTRPAFTYTRHLTLGGDDIEVTMCVEHPSSFPFSTVATAERVAINMHEQLADADAIALCLDSRDYSEFRGVLNLVASQSRVSSLLREIGRAHV